MKVGITLEGLREGGWEGLEGEKEEGKWWNYILIKGGGGEEGKNMREQDVWDGGRTERESKDRDILIMGVIMGLARNSQEFIRVTPANALSNSGESIWIGLPL